MTLIDIILMDKLYIWSNMSEDPCLAEHDKVMRLNSWNNKFGFAKAHSIPRPTSDHASICLESREHKITEVDYSVLENDS